MIINPITKFLSRCFFICLLINCLNNTAAASVEPWAIIDNSVSGYRPTIVIPDNNDIAAKINKDINDYMYRQIAHFKNLELNEPKFSYILCYEGSTVISLLIKCEDNFNYRYGDTYETFHGLTYSKINGQRLPLEYFVKLTLNDLRTASYTSLYNVTWQRNSRTLENLSFTKYHIEMLLNNVSNDFFLLGGGGIALIYPKYERNVAIDFTSVKLDSGQIKYFNYNYNRQ